MQGVHIYAGYTKCAMVAETLSIVHDRILKNGPKPHLVLGLSHLLTNVDLILELRWILSADSLHSLVKDIGTFVYAQMGLGQVRSPFLHKKLEAIVKLAKRDAKDSNDKAWTKWIERAFRNGNADAHAFTRNGEVQSALY